VQKKEIGLGQYNTGAVASATKIRPLSALMSKTERGDINKRSKVETGDLGPGAYDGGKQLGKDVIGYSWGKPKAEKVVVDNRDYGYDPEKEFKLTRHSSPSAIIKKSGASRMDFADKSKADLGPGQYDDSKGFGS